MLLVAGCGNANTATPPFGADLSGLRTARIEISGVAFEVWLAETPAQRAQGLMNATPGQLAPLADGTPRGMLFVFPSEQLVSFTMRDTYVPLDLAHFRTDGLLLETHALTPLEETPVPAGQPLRYSLEVSAGELAARGLGPGHTLALPLP